jgi:serine protease Do
VTVGIVSATGRNNLPLLPEEAYQDFIQTDAAINPGNSGGPLVDLNGKVVGINTAIYSQSGGYEGIGFAVPSAMARRVVESLIKQGRVIRGYLGVAIQPLTAPLRNEFQVPKEVQGVLVANVHGNSPAEKAGLQTGDVIVSIDGKSVTNPASLRNRTAALDVGAKVPLAFYRAGKEHNVTVTIAEFPQGRVVAMHPLGFHLFELPPGQSGFLIGTVIIDAVVPDSPADRAGLKPGMRIVEIDEKPVNTREECDAALRGYKPDEGLPMKVITRDGRPLTLTVGGPNSH